MREMFIAGITALSLGACATAEKPVDPVAAQKSQLEDTAKQMGMNAMKCVFSAPGKLAIFGRVEGGIRGVCVNNAQVEKQGEKKKPAFKNPSPFAPRTELEASWK